MKAKKLSLFILSSVLILFPLVSLAAGLVPCGGQGEPACQFCHLFVLFKNIVDFFLIRIVPPLAALMLAIGGFMYIFAYFGGGEIGGKAGPALLSQANKLLTSVVLGLLIIFGAWIFVNTFFMLIGVTDWDGWSLKESWWKIDCPVVVDQPIVVDQHIISSADFQNVLAKAIADYFVNPSNSILTEAELKDLLDVSVTGSTVDLSGNGSRSGKKLIDIYNKAKAGIVEGSDGVRYALD